MAERACVQRLQKEFRALCKVRVVSDDDAWERAIIVRFWCFCGFDHLILDFRCFVSESRQLCPSLS
jgi:hypothetical protein